MRTSRKSLLAFAQSAGRLIGKYAVVLVLLALAGLVFKTLAFALPAQPVQDNLASDAALFEQWGDYPVLNVYSVDKRPAQLDFFTEAELLVGAWSVDSAHPLRSATENHTFDDSGADKLLRVLDDGGASLAPIARDKYWWGALTLLRPLLAVGSYAEASMLLQAVYLLAFFLCGMCLYRQLGAVPAVAFAIGFVCVDGMTAAPLYATAFSVLCAFGGMLAVCRCRNLGKSFSMILFVTGIATAYFDWMSSPLLACGLPVLVGLVRLAQEQRLAHLWRGVWQTLRAGLAWCFGWAGMIAAKWAVSWAVSGSSLTAFLQKALIEDIVAEEMTTPFVITCVKLLGSTLPGRFVITRLLQSGNMGASNADLYAYVKQIVQKDPLSLIVPNLWVIVLVLALGIAFLCLLVRCKDKNARTAAVLCLCVAAVPFAWALVMGRHTSAHYWFVYRMLAMTFMGLIVSAWLLWRAARAKVDQTQATVQASLQNAKESAHEKAAEQ